MISKIMKLVYYVQAGMRKPCFSNLPKHWSDKSNDFNLTLAPPFQVSEYLP